MCTRPLGLWMLVVAPGPQGPPGRGGPGARGVCEQPLPGEYMLRCDPLVMSGYGRAVADRLTINMCGMAP